MGAREQPTENSVHESFNLTKSEEGNFLGVTKIQDNFR